MRSRPPGWRKRPWNSAPKTALFPDLQAAGKQDEAAIALAYGDYLSVGDLIKRDAYPEKAEAYNKTAGAFPAKLISGLWGVGQLDTFGR